MGLDLQVNLWNVGTERFSRLFTGVHWVKVTVSLSCHCNLRREIVPCVDLELPRPWLLTPMLLP